MYRNDSYLKNKKVQAGNESWRESEGLGDILKNLAGGQARSDEEEVVNGPNKDKTRSKRVGLLEPFVDLIKFL